MENILPGFRRDRIPDPIDEYERQSNPRPYAAGYGRAPYEYTGQPAGFEHLGSPPKQRLQDMDPRTIAQLGYEGPEGERRKVEAINEQIYDLERERNVLAHQGVPRRPEYYEGYDDRRHDRRRYEDSSYGRPHVYEGDYRRSGSGSGSGRHGEYYAESDPYGRGRYSIPSPVTVERTVKEDGTLVEHVYPNNTASAMLQRPDHGKIHYGRQDSFPETVLQDAVATHHGRVPPSAYHSSSSPYGRRGSDYGSSSDYRDDGRRY